MLSLKTWFLIQFLHGLLPVYPTETCHTCLLYLQYRPSEFLQGQWKKDNRKLGAELYVVGK